MRAPAHPHAVVAPFHSSGVAAKDPSPQTRWEGDVMGARGGKGCRRGWVRARPVPARVPAFQETWKPKIKVRRDRCPEPGAWVPGWALSPGYLGGDPAGANAARRRNPGSEPQPRTSDFQLCRPLLRQSTGRLCPAPGARPRQSPRLPARRRGRAPSSRLLGAALSERSGRGGRAASARCWGPRSAGRLASLLRAERAQGRPKVRSGLSARPVRPSGKENEKETAKAFVRVCVSVCVWGGALG